MHPGVHIDNIIQLDHLKTISEPQQISVQLVTRHYKHQKADRPTIFEIAAQSQHCPMPHINRYLRVHSSSPGPLFIFADKTLLYQGHISQVSFQLVLHMLNMTRICTRVILSELDQQPQLFPKVSLKFK